MSETDAYIRGVAAGEAVWFSEREKLRAENERLLAIIKEAEFQLSVAIIPDGHLRCENARKVLYAALADQGKG